MANGLNIKITRLEVWETEKAVKTRTEGESLHGYRTYSNKHPEHFFKPNSLTRSLTRSLRCKLFLVIPLTSA